MTMQRMCWRTIALALVFGGAFVTASAQRQGVGTGAGTGVDTVPGHSTSAGSGEPLAPGMQEKVDQERNSERQKRLVEDTAKLLELATQLKADVDKTNKNTMSIDVIKRADEIEKLAHAVKQRMKG